MLFGDSHLSAAIDGPATEFWAVFQEISVRLLVALHGKHTARPLTDDATWCEWLLWDVHAAFM
jgi:hypothetical protein